MSVTWNPWHGCHKISEGCRNCYVYRQDFNFEKDSSIVTKNATFDLPISKKKNGEYKITSGELVNTCFTSDFFVEEADEWRADVWKMMRVRSDLSFFFITKRPERFHVSLPSDWGDGYENVHIACTVENQDRVDFRLPIFKSLPIKHKSIAVSPLLEKINLERFLDETIESVVVGGESGKYARVCEYEWVLDIREQCLDRYIPFWFHQTGSKFYKDGKLYHIPRNLHHEQARKANIDFRINF